MFTVRKKKGQKVQINKKENRKSKMQTLCKPAILLCWYTAFPDFPQAYIVKEMFPCITFIF